MSGSLIKIQETTVSSATANVTLTGIDTTFDVYKFIISNLKVSSDDVPALRVTKSGTADTTANYDYAFKNLKADTSFSNGSGTNETKAFIMPTVDDGTGNTGANANAEIYLFNFSNASEYSFLTVEGAQFQANEHTARGYQGGFVHTVASASDGVQIFNINGNNIAGGDFKLYGLVK
jgi:hypothetical protein